MPDQKGGAAEVLLQRILSLPGAAPARVAQSLGLTTKRLEACEHLERRLPRHAQWRLAIIAAAMVEQAPRIARRGRQLRAQLRAQAEYECHVTAVHAYAAPRSARWFSRRGRQDAAQPGGAFGER